MPHNYYQVLGIAETASPEDVKKAYRALSKAWHPDKNNSPEATKKMAEINKAYAVLKDEARRDEYDYLHSLGKYAPKPRKSTQTKSKARGTRCAPKGAKRGPNNTTTPKAESDREDAKQAAKEPPKSARTFNPNQPCGTCHGAGKVKIAQKFKSMDWLCPTCEGIGSR